MAVGSCQVAAPCNWNSLLWLAPFVWLFMFYRASSLLPWLSWVLSDILCAPPRVFAASLASMLNLVLCIWFYLSTACCSSTSLCRPSVILNFRSPIMVSLKSACSSSYRSLIETIALNCLVFEKIGFFVLILATDGWMYKLFDRPIA